jgi:hypothetical protein
MPTLHLPSWGQPCAVPKDYTHELGWTHHRTADGTVYTGHYRATGLRYQGWVLLNDKGKLSFYIHKPPMGLLRDTDYAGCFHFRNDGWCLVTFKPYDVPADVSSGIAAIQKALRNAFETRTAKRRRGTDD